MCVMQSVTHSPIQRTSGDWPFLSASMSCGWSVAIAAAQRLLLSSRCESGCVDGDVLVVFDVDGSDSGSD